MITFIQGHNIFYSDAKTIVCPVNTVGVMGNGLARAFRDRYPGLYDAYKRACASGVFQKQGYFVFKDPDFKTQVLCFPTKRHWKQDSQLRWIRTALKKLADTYKEHNITSIVFPPIGCGKGNLTWDEVKPVIIDELTKTDMEIEVCEPGGYNDGSW